MFLCLTNHVKYGLPTSLAHMAQLCHDDTRRCDIGIDDPLFVAWNVRLQTGQLLSERKCYSVNLCILWNRTTRLDDPVRRPGNIERYPRLRQRFCITSVIADTDLQITTVVARPLA